MVPVPILLQSGDVVVMAKESRLVYHGVPKIWSPSISQPVPSALCLQALLSTPDCSLCNGTVKDDEEPPSAGRPDRQEPPSAGKPDREEPHSAGRPDREEPPSAGWPDREEPPSAGRPDREEPPSAGLVHCRSCLQESSLAKSWTDFMSYLHVSRININVRQVNAT